MNLFPAVELAEQSVIGVNRRGSSDPAKNNLEREKHL